MDNKYKHNEYLIIVDFIENGEVYYRKFKKDEFIGAYRMSEIDFREELKNNELKW